VTGTEMKSSFRNPKLTKHIHTTRLLAIDVQEDVLQKAKPINLNAQIEESSGEPYFYNITDKAKIDEKPPAAI